MGVAPDGSREVEDESRASRRRPERAGDDHAVELDAAGAEVPLDPFQWHAGSDKPIKDEWGVVEVVVDHRIIMNRSAPRLGRNRQTPGV